MTSGLITDFFADNADLGTYLSGVLGGVCVLVMLLGLLVGAAYRERMLWWHAGTVAMGLMATWSTGNQPALAATFWVLQLALAALTLRIAAGAAGAMRLPSHGLLALALLLALFAVTRPLSEHVPVWLLLPWGAVTAWCLFRTWSQSGRWIAWLAVGQLALALQGWLFMAPLPALGDSEAPLASEAALALFAVSVYLAMVWSSRLRSENSLRLEARERTDPLTGLATPRVFYDRVDGALIRSRKLGYASALILIRADNIDAIVADQQLDNNEAVILAASRAIASTLRPQDSAARLGGNRFAVLAEGIAEGASAEMATRILAHGLRAGEWGLQGSELQFQMTVVEVAQPDMKARAILLQLEEALHHLAGRGSRQHIVTLPPISPPRQVRPA